jgi:peptidoglycan DL-endopeptidase LytE
VTRTKRILLATGVALALAVPGSGAIAEAAPATTTTDTTITVSGGDSLAGIAYRYGVRLSALLRANSMTVTTVIHPGDTLVIPAGASLPAASNSVAATSGGASGAGSSGTTGTTGTTYTVVAGDALAGIAWRHGVKLGALVKANGISVTSVIMPGQTLTIPPATMAIPTPRASTPAPAAAPAGGIVAAAAATSAATSSTTGSLDTLLTYLRAQVGTPYQFFSAGPDTFDCSGLVVAGFRQIGMSMPHQSRALARLGTPVDWRTEAIAPGDLVFTSAVNDPALITHVGVALDSQRWVHAVGVGRTVSIGSLPSSDRIMAVQRITLP